MHLRRGDGGGEGGGWIPIIEMTDILGGGWLKERVGG